MSFLLKEQTLPGFHHSQDRLGVIDYDEIIQDFKSRVLPTRRMSIAAGLLPKITIEEAPDTESEDTKEVNEDKDNIILAEEDEKALRLPKIRRTSKVNESAFRVEMGFS